MARKQFKNGRTHDALSCADGDCKWGSRMQRSGAGASVVVAWSHVGRRDGGGGGGWWCGSATDCGDELARNGKAADSSVAATGTAEGASRDWSAVAGGGGSQAGAEPGKSGATRLCLHLGRMR